MKTFLFAFLGFLLLTLAAFSQERSNRVISGQGVYFFGPSIAEADSVPTDESEALSDFATYSNQVAIYAKSNGLNYGYISARTIQIRYGSMRVFTLSRDTVEFGTIFTDNKKAPLLIPYVAIDAKLKEKAKEYFGLK